MMLLCLATPALAYSSGYGGSGYGYGYGSSSYGSSSYGSSSYGSSSYSGGSYGYGSSTYGTGGSGGYQGLGSWVTADTDTDADADADTDVDVDVDSDADADVAPTGDTGSKEVAIDCSGCAASGASSTGPWGLLALLGAWTSRRATPSG